MTSRERIIAALNYEETDLIPTERDDVAGPRYSYGQGQSRGVVNKKGIRVDAWGCVWKAAEDGVCGEVKVSPLSDWSSLSKFSPPWQVIYKRDFSKVNEDCAKSDKFIIPMFDQMPNPFERMQHLRGTENLLIDLAYGDANIYKLRDLVHEYYMKILEAWVSTEIDGIHIHDDWGSQISLLISPEMWREYYKPLYNDYCQLAHKYGKFVVMHSDGYTKDIIPDLIDVGVDALNLQLFCMDIENIAELYHGKVAFWGEIDRQTILPHGTEEEIRKAVRRIANAFFTYKRSGIIGQCFSGKDIPPRSMEIVYDEWRKISQTRVVSY